MTFTFYRPAEVSEAVGLAERLGAGARFLAGGTDLVVQMAKNKESPEALIDIGGLAELGGIAMSDDGFTIGALTTHKAIERHEAFAGALEALRESARVVGGHQIR